MHTTDCSRRELMKHAGAALLAATVLPCGVTVAGVSRGSVRGWQLTRTEDAIADGFLRKRLELSYRRLQEPYFQWTQISALNFEEFPGDALGRAINGLSFLGQSLHTGPSENLREIITRLPELWNKDGYLGRVLPADRADEDSLAGHNGLLCGLVEYYHWTRDPQVLAWLRTLRDSLFVPMRGSIESYRSSSEQRPAADWRLSTFDIGQLFLSLDGLTRAYELIPSAPFKAMIDTMIDRYRTLDVVRISAQTHSMLSATRGVVRWHRLHGRSQDLALAEQRFAQYKRFALTETYANYNWFNRPTHTEGCALVDSFELATDLWSVTEKPGYLEDAHLILFNAMLPGQCLNGGFGVGECVGATTDDGTVITRAQSHSEAPWCCSMRGAEGLVYVARASHFIKGDAVALPFYNNVRSTLRFADGSCQIEQASQYPHAGALRVKVLTSEVRGRKRLRFFVPSWVERNSVEVKVGGELRPLKSDGAFVELALKLDAGTQIDMSFRQAESQLGLVDPARSPGYARFRRGPLLLGLAASQMPAQVAAPASAQGAFAVGLRPLLDVLDPTTGREESAQVLFRIPGSAAAGTRQRTAPIDPLQASLNSDISRIAVTTYRQSPTDPRGSALFSALESQATVLDAFVWDQAQRVSQVVLEWDEGTTMPALTDVVLRWLPAGAVAATHRSPADVNRGLREMKGAGIIGNGRRWVFSLSRELGQGAIDNLAVLVVPTSAARTPPQRIFILPR